MKILFPAKAQSEDERKNIRRGLRGFLTQEGKIQNGWWLWRNAFKPVQGKGSIIGEINLPAVIQVGLSAKAGIFAVATEPPVGE